MSDTTETAFPQKKNEKKKNKKKKKTMVHAMQAVTESARGRHKWSALLRLTIITVRMLTNVPTYANARLRAAADC